MNKLFVLAFIVLASVHTNAQTDDASKYASLITTEDLFRHLSIIAGEEMEGRETGTAGAEKAAAYIEAQFKEIGLLPAPLLKGYQQAYPLLRDSLLKAELKIGDLIATYGTDYFVPGKNLSHSLQAKKIMFAGYGIEDPKYDDYKGLNVTGKIVLLLLGEPKTAGNYIISGSAKSSEWSFPGIVKKIALAKSKGAAGVLLVNPSQSSFLQRSVDESRRSNLYYPEASNLGHIPYAQVSHAFAAKLLGNAFDSILKKGKEYSALNMIKWEKTMMSNWDHQKKVDTTFATNVLGFVEGSDKKDEYVFVTAHYDHLGKRNGKIYYGADDDGSGTVAVLEMAESFAKAKAEGKGPRRTLVFMTVSGEEKGLWGSEYYSDNPVFPLDKTSVDLNIDMIGRIDTERKTADTTNYIYVVGHDKISSEMPIINEAMNNKYSKLNLDYKFDDPQDPHRIYYRSDHYNFARKGVPVLFFYDGMLQADYHQPTDTVDKINWDLYRTRAKMIFHTAWEIANRDELLKRDKPLPTGQR